MPRMTDILNEDGSKLRTEDLDVAHRDGLLHRSVHVLVVNDAGDIFIRRRPANKPIYPNLWTSSVGTHVLTGDGPNEVAQSALKDFLGIDAPLHRVGERHVRDAFENELINVYICNASEVPALNPNESSEGMFATVAHVKQLDASGQTTPHLPRAAEAYLS